MFSLSDCCLFVFVVYFSNYSFIFILVSSSPASRDTILGWLLWAFSFIWIIPSNCYDSLMHSICSYQLYIILKSLSSLIYEIDIILLIWSIFIFSLSVSIAVFEMPVCYEHYSSLNHFLLIMNVNDSQLLVESVFSVSSTLNQRTNMSLSDSLMLFYMLSPSLL